MPLLQRVVEPVYLSRGAIPVEVPNELESVTNGTLANIVRQLSSLSKHAEDMFAELFHEATFLIKRASSLQGRIDRLAVKVTQLDSNVEEVSLQDIHMRKAFKSTIVYDQQVVSRSTIPTAMLDTYGQCDKPPPLDKLNPYREDGKDGLKFYTDPNYFFDLWRQEMIKDTERIMLDKGKKPHRPRTEGGGRRNKKVRQPHNTREKFRMNAPQQEFIADRTVHYVIPQAQVRVDEDGVPLQSLALRPNSLELQSSYSPDSYSRGGVSPINHYPAPPAYIEHPQYSQYQPPPPYTPNSEIHLTPSAYSSGRILIRNAGTMRPAHPPPAPPGGSANSPTVGTPVNCRGKAVSNGRETLPPPPPPPGDVIINGQIIPQELLKMQLMQNSIPNLGSLTSRLGTPNHQLCVEEQIATKTPENNTPDSMDLPPPPLTPDKDQNKPPTNVRTPSPPPPLSMGASPPATDLAPPPPPPPPPLPPLVNGPVVDNGNHRMVTSPNNDSSKAICNRKPVNPSTEESLKCSTSLPAVQDPRSDLLSAIREGIKLRKVEDIKQKEVEKQTPPHDVASILARRVAMEFSDSDTASESEYDSEAWDEDGST